LIVFRLIGYFLIKKSVPETEHSIGQGEKRTYFYDAKILKKISKCRTH